MKFLNLKRVLCLSPHPDDVEIGMMGTIFTYHDTKFDILCMTKGGAKGYDETNELDRRKEVDNVWNFWENLTDHVQVYHSKFSPISLIEYHTFSSLNSWQPNLFVNIQSIYHNKLKSLEEFKSQSHKSYFQKKTLDSFHSNFQCNKKGKGMVEQFKILELFGV